MITWDDDFNGRVSKLISIHIAQRVDGLLDVQLTMIGGSSRRLCDGSVQDAHEVAEQMCANELPSVVV